MTAIEHKNEKKIIDKYLVKLDHIAYRVKQGERKKKIAELKTLIPYREYKSFKVIIANAITTCLKLTDAFPVIVISEGLSEDSVVSRYCQKYGSRVHHIAYLVKDIDEIVRIQRQRKVEFTTSEVIGSEEEGIKQIFTIPTKTTNHIFEYIQRFGDFDGFFTPTNIADLMLSTENLK